MSEPAMTSDPSADVPAFSPRDGSRRSAALRAWLGVFVYTLGGFLSMSRDSAGLGMLMMLIATLLVLGYPSLGVTLWALLNTAATGFAVWGVCDMLFHPTRYSGYGMLIVVPVCAAVLASMFIGAGVLSWRRKRTRG